MQVEVSQVKIQAYQTLEGHWGSEIMILFNRKGSYKYAWALSRVNHSIPNTTHSQEAQKQAFIKRVSKWDHDK